MANSHSRRGAPLRQIIIPLIVCVSLSACAAQHDATDQCLPSPGSAATGGGAMGCTDGPEPRGM
jgi:hypothetical protein